MIFNAKLFLFLNSGQLLFYLMFCIVISTTPSELYFLHFYENSMGFDGLMGFVAAK